MKNYLSLVLCLVSTCSCPEGLPLVFSQEAEVQSPAASSALDLHAPEFWQLQDGRPVEEHWEFKDGEVQLVNPGRANLLSQPLPANFELSFQWKIDAKVNSGLKYRVRQFDGQWLGIEYQMIDEPIPLPEPHHGATASIYDLVAPTLDKPLLSAGQWNSARIVANGHSLQHYLNDQLVCSATTSGPQWQATVALSKFYGRDGFGLPQDGDRLMLTDHGGRVTFRNFVFHPLPEPNMEAPTESAPQLGNALRNGWADQDSIVLWTRTTAASEMRTDGPQFIDLTRDERSRLEASTDPAELLSAQLPPDTNLEEMFGACPGAAGEVRLTYFPDRKRNASITTDWSRTFAHNDFTHQWRLTGLLPGVQYAAIVEARPIGEETITAVVRGSFQTAPAADALPELTFCVTTCHDFPRRDDGLRGHKIYPNMTLLEPNFIVHAGDIEYYDKPDPWSWTVELMRFRWARLFSLPNNRQFYANHTSYFIKDDHDTLKNDCWAGQRFGSVTFEEGVRLFNLEQFPSRSPRYATVSWGRDAQIWVLEGRDYRSPNTQPDGPEKTILGAQQKEWLFRTLKESTATFKLVFSPTPIVGPDRNNKRDNHANDVFEHEGNQLRELFSSVDGVIVFCGDRHWQYASVDDQTGLWEFGCGPGSEKHELGWKPGDVRPVHRFLRVQGGFLSGQLEHTNDGQPQLTLRHHDVDGNPLNEFKFPATETEGKPSTSE